MINYLGEDKIYIGDDESISIDYFEKNDIFWREAYLECGEERVFIGSYFKDGEFLETSPYYAAILRVEKGKDGIPTISVKRLFDLKNKKQVIGTSEELLDIFEHEFSAPKDDEDRKR